MFPRYLNIQSRHLLTAPPSVKNRLLECEPYKMAALFQSTHNCLQQCSTRGKQTEVLIEQQ